MLVRSSLTSRGSLFIVILVLLSDPDELGCSALFSFTWSPFHHNITANVIVVTCSSHILRSHLLVMSPVPVFWSMHVVTLGCALNADDLPKVTEVVVSSPALCPAQFSSEAPTRDDRRLDAWSHVVQLHRPVHD